MVETKRIVAKSSRRRVPKTAKSNEEEEDHDTAHHLINAEYLDTLQWRDITTDSLRNQRINDDNCFGYTAFEEVDGVDVVYENTDSGRVVRFVEAGSKGKSHNENTTEKNKKSVTINNKKKKKSKNDALQSDNLKVAEVAEEDEVELLAWERFNLHPLLKKGLKELGFEEPTQIQASVLSAALHKPRDIIGAAETGSGKTLSFGLPILNWLLKNGRNDRNGLPALVLAPTRELAIQIKDHLTAVSKSTKIKIMAILGGMALVKQKRLINHKPDIIIATPGRLWQWISEEDDTGYLANLHSSLRFLVIDEADRMVEKGHFADLDKILNCVEKKEVINEWGDNYELQDDDKGNAEETLIGTEEDRSTVATPRQTFIFSATINKLKRHAGDDTDENDTISAIMEKIQFRDPNPEIIDFTKTQLLSRTLSESRIDCLLEEKDLYLYYLIRKYPGRTILFVNTIECVRRLGYILSGLKVNSYCLHAQMQQRQRLKNLDRFKSANECVLIASDVASRGLDIQNVEHIIHYQLPKSAELYIHRSGRTARAKKDGMSILLCCPEEVKNYRMICKLLKKECGIEHLDVDRMLLDDLREPVRIAKQLAELQHHKDKKTKEESWIRKVAEEMDVEVDEGLLSSDEDLENAKVSGKQNQEGLKRKLDSILEKPLLPRKIHSAFLTANNRAKFAAEILDKLRQ